MAEEKRDKQDGPSEELSQGLESDAKPKAEPQPNLEHAKDEIEAEDRFEATDN
jgi:hypothetical protein